MKYDINSISKRKKNIEIIKKILGVMLIIFIYNLILIFLSSDDLNDKVNLFGYKAYIITSNSMEPVIHLDDAVIVKKCKESSLAVGDIITFSQNGEVITHRILEIEENQQREYITKGDNNNIEDIEKVLYSNIEGKKVLIIPYLGKIIKIIDNKLIVLIVVLILLILCFNNIQEKEKLENRREKKRIEEEKQRNSYKGY